MSVGEPTSGVNDRSLARRFKQRRLTKQSRRKPTRRLLGWESLEDRCLLAGTSFAVPPNDPLFPQQWNLQNTGQTGGTPGADINVTPVWAQGDLGQGITVGVVDSGVYFAHPDLVSNYRSDLSFNFFNNTPDPTPPLSPLLTAAGSGLPADFQGGEDSHGTAVAGIIAASGNNGIGGTGIAPDAQFGAERVVTTDPSGNLVQGGTAQQLDTLTSKALGFQNQKIDVYNNSWGGAGQITGGTLGVPAPLTIAAMQKGAIGIPTANPAVPAGRGGLGNIYVFAAGNSGQSFGNTNNEPETASRFAITVAALGDDGKQALYSNPGASVLVSAPGGHDFIGAADEVGIPTTSVLAEPDPNNPGSMMYVPTYTDASNLGMNGTSAATPAVSGVVALMLSANPNLSWRDVQQILAETATKNDPTDPGWFNDGYGYTSDGAIVPVDSSGHYAGTAPLPAGVTVSPFHVNDKYGFGLVNAAAAVNLARDWTPLQPDDSVNPVTSGLVNVSQAIPDGVAGGVSSQVTFTGGLHVERAEVTLNITHPQRGDIEVILTSPNGTRSILQTSRSFKTANGDTTFDLALDNSGNLIPAANYTNWSTSTVQDWGESSAGTWTVTVADEDFNGQAGTFDSFQLTLYGTPDYAPIAQDLSLNTQQNTPVSVNLLSHAYDTDGTYTIAPGSLSIVSQPANGSVSVDPQTGQVVYTPNFYFSGTDTFTYLVKDTKGVASRTATVTINVNHVNQAPVANDDTASTTYSTPVAINVLANDTDPTGTFVPSTVTIVNQPSFGTATINRSTGVITYTPGPNFTINDSFTYTVSDSNGLTSNQATVTINLTQPAPVANNVVQPAANENVTQQVNVLAQVTGSANPSSVTVITQPQFGTTSVDPVTGTISYTPEANFFGTDSFTFAVRNFQGALSNTATVLLTVLAQGMPLALNHEFVLMPGASVITGIRALDNPAGTSTLTAQLVTPTALGTVILNPDGSFTYIQGPGFHGLDQFAYQVSNGTAVSNVAVIRLVSPNFHFVERLYQSVLNRVGSDADLLGWTARLDAGESRSQVAMSFLNSAEYQSDLINSVYEQLLKRPVDGGGLLFWLGEMQLGVPIETIMISIASSPEYLALHGNTTQGQIAGFYQDFLGRAGSQSDILFWAGQVAAGTPPASVAASFVNSTEYRNDLITGYYVNYLGHTPDLGGLRYWSSLLAAGFSRTTVQTGILASGEYFSQS
ncbi:MAG TPA: Ig-like domain-containing protein [Pirellulales bacterium]|nr:Ig-like domain-containing protein [Pirellulales bacterium]